jgi:hypothetical protein
MNSSVRLHATEADEKPHRNTAQAKKPGLGFRLKLGSEVLTMAAPKPQRGPEAPPVRLERTMQLDP